jgi:hypothetical protein
MEATVDLLPRGPDWMPITPKTGSLFHADSHPGGLAFSEFRGFESWQAVAISHAGRLALILANPVMIDAYQAGIPGNGKPFPDGAKMAKIH